jgi:outer membrane protein
VESWALIALTPPGLLYTPRMRTLVALALLGLGLLVAPDAHAQFQNRSLGARLGFVDESGALGLKPSIPVPTLSIDGTLYVESGFDVGLRFTAGIQRSKLNGLNQVVLYPAAQLRYLIVEDYLRPYIGAAITYIHIFDTGSGESAGIAGTATENLVGFSPLLGLEYSISEQVSIGGSIEPAILLQLNGGPYFSLQAFFRVSAGF